MATALATPATPKPARKRKSAFRPSKYQKGIFTWITNGSGDGIVNAVAGSGKTTTLVQAAKLLTEDALFVAFNKHIAEELQTKLGGTSMTAKTIHGVGMGCLTRALGRTQLDGSKYRKLARSYSDTATRIPLADRKKLTDTLTKLADFARLTLANISDQDAMLSMMAHYGVDVTDERVLNAALSLLPALLKQGERQAEQSKIIDFTDMLWLPTLWKLTPPQFGFVFVDECQDLNRAQLELVLRCRRDGGRMLFVGDPRQSIMGFAGADNESFWNIKQRTNAHELPLSICYRCPASHVALAQEIVPQIEARPKAPVGTIADITEAQVPAIVQAGDMILCRLTAPLIETCIGLIRKRIPARVRGRDLGKQLTNIVQAVEKLPGYTWERFGEYLTDYEDDQTWKLSQREGSESQVQSLTDRCAAVRVCWQEFGSASASALCAEIEALFSDDHMGVMLSTVHRAKGLENRRVFILKPEKLPLVWPKQQEWEAEQEDNIKYVALTRATEALYWVVA